MIDGLKISGSAQRRTSKAILHHGTLLYDVNQYRMLNYIRGDKAVETSKGTCSNYKPVTCVKDLVDIDMKEAYEVIKNSLLEGKEYYLSNWTNEEIARAEELVRTRYSNDDWNLKL
jgi:lipoate-protein ligase A